MSKTTINQGIALDERQSRGLNKAAMADVVGIEGPNAEQILTDFETGFRPVKGPAQRVYQYLNRARWAAGELLSLPKWTLGNSAPQGVRVIHHNEWPRFVGRALAEELHPDQWRFKKAEMPAVPMTASTGYRQLVVALIDHVPDGVDLAPLLAQAAERLEADLLVSKPDAN